MLILITTKLNIATFKVSILIKNIKSQFAEFARLSKKTHKRNIQKVYKQSLHHINLNFSKF